MHNPTDIAIRRNARFTPQRKDHAMTETNTAKIAACALTGVAALLLAVQPAAQAARISNTESWDSGTANNWTISTGTLTYNATGGVGDTGCLSTSVTTAENPPMLKGTTQYGLPSGGVFHSDVDARYAGGNPDGGLVLSFYMKNLTIDDPEDDDRFPRVQIFDDFSEYAGTTTQWRFDATASNGSPISTTEWTRYTVTFNTNWTDLQATAAGWVQGGAATKSFAAAWQDVDSFRLGVVGNLSQNYPNGTGIMGVDGLSLSNIPEPTTAALGLIGSLVLGLRRRRR